MTRYAVQLSSLRGSHCGQGAFLGRLDFGPLGTVGPAHAYLCSLDEAVALAAQHGGQVVTAPTWDSARRTYQWSSVEVRS